MKFIKILLFCSISIFANAQNWYPIRGGINAGRAELFSFEDKLFVGGSFTAIDGKSASNIAYWDKTRWIPFPQVGNLPYFFIHSFTTYKNELYAYARGSTSISYGHIMKYHKVSNTWIELPNSEVFNLQQNETTSAGFIKKIIAFKNDLYICGLFDRIGDKDIKNLAKWNGTEWSPVINNLGPKIEVESISRAIIFNNELIISGRLKDVNDQLYWGLSIWDGENWSNLEGELIPKQWPISSDYRFYDLEVFQGDLYLSGQNFRAVEGGQKYSLIKWDGDNWVGIHGFEREGIIINKIKNFGNYLALAGFSEEDIPDTNTFTQYLYKGDTMKKIAGSLPYHIMSFQEFNNQLFAGTNIDPTFGFDNVGVYRLGKINDDDEDSNSKCDFFPNPTAGEFIITYEAEENTSTIIRFYSISGVLIQEKIFNDLKGPYLRRFNIQDFHTGIYVVQIQAKGINESKMIVKN